MARRTVRTPDQVDLLKAAIRVNAWEELHGLVLGGATECMVAEAARRARRDLLSITLAWQTWAVLNRPQAEVDAVNAVLTAQLPMFALPEELGAGR